MAEPEQAPERIDPRIGKSNAVEQVNARKEAFLQAFGLTGNVTMSAQAAGVNRNEHYYWLGTDAGYAERFKAAQRESGERLEAVAIQRAVQGVEEPVFYRGQKVGTVRRYSDRLLIVLLAATMPDKYGRLVRRAGDDPDPPDPPPPDGAGEGAPAEGGETVTMTERTITIHVGGGRRAPRSIGGGTTLPPAPTNGHGPEEPEA